MATNENWTDQSGERQERTEWHRIVAWGKLAENCAKLLSKGKQVYIEGRLQTRQWDDRDGNKRYTTEVVASNMQILTPVEGSNRFNNIPEEQNFAGNTNDSQDPPEYDDIPF